MRAMATRVSLVGRSFIRASCFSRGDRVSLGLDDVLMVNLSLIRLDVDEVDIMDEVSDLADLVENIFIVGVLLMIVD